MTVNMLYQIKLAKPIKILYKVGTRWTGLESIQTRKEFKKLTKGNIKPIHWSLDFDKYTCKRQIAARIKMVNNVEKRNSLKYITKTPANKYTYISIWKK